MGRMTGSIPNFVNGVSQQPAALRLTSQAEEQINCYSTVAKGLIKRPPTDHVAKIAATLPDTSAVHIINRDVVERYVVTYDGSNGLQVFDFEGNEKTVNGTQTYLSCTDPSLELKFLTVADYTFILNTTVEVKKDITKSPSQNPTALISFGTVQPGSTIKVQIDGVEKASQAISDIDPSEQDTNWAAQQILDDLVANGYNTGDWECGLTETAGSVIYIRNTAGTDFDVTVSDGSNGLGIKIVKDKVQYFEDLPRQGLEGFKVEVAGNPDTGAGAYWVEFAQGAVPVWSETVAPNVDIEIDADTFVHQLVRESDGTFTFGPMSITARTAGTDDSNPFPSFIGETLNDIFFHKSRLSVCAGEGIIMSQAGKFFNFFRTSVTTLLDGDPIDVGSNHTKVSILRHAVPYQKQLLLWSDQTQFQLTQGQILSPATVGMNPTTEYESSIIAAPAAVGNFVFFGVEKTDFATLRELFVTDTNENNDAREITGHIPNYIPAGILKIAGTSNEEALVVKTGGSTGNELYVYKYFWSGNEKIQSSWSKWTFPDVTEILGYGFIKSTLYLVMKRADGVFLEKMEMDSGSTDESGTGQTFRVDRKIYSSSTGVSSSYDSGTDQTTFTFSDITWKSVPKVIGCAGNTEWPPGLYADIVGSPTSYNANTIVVDGDATGEDFVFGIPFDAEYELSEIVPRAGTQGGAEVPITEGRLQLLWINFRYANSGHFKVQVILPHKTSEYEFNGRTLGSSENPINDVPVDTAGSFRVPLFSKSDRCRIKIVSNDPLPFRLISADWVGNLLQKFRRT